jgi:inner membrane protein
LDNVTHALLGYAVYAGTKERGSDRNHIEKHKKWYIAAAVLGAEIPDIEAFTTFFGYEAYLYWHRDFTHSILFAPFMALFTIAILRLFSRQRSLSWKRMYWLALGGVTTHWLFDFFNTWGTGLLEPFVNERYSLGILPIIDIVLIIIFAVGFYLRKKVGTRRAFQWVWTLIFIYISIQAGQNVWIKQEMSARYDQLVVAADFIPGQFTVVGKKGDTVEIYSRSLFVEGEKIILESNEDPALVEEVLKDPEAQAIAWFSPFVVIAVEQQEGETRAILFDPRFYRNGESFLKAEVVLKE